MRRLVRNRLSSQHQDWKTMFELQHNWAFARFHTEWICEGSTSAQRIMIYSHQLVLYSKETTIRVFDTRTKRILSSLESPFLLNTYPSCLFLDAHASGTGRVLVGYSHGGWALFLLSNGALLHCSLPVGSRKSLYHAIISRSTLVTLSEDFVLRVFRVHETGATLVQTRSSSVCAHPASIHFSGPDLVIIYTQKFFDGSSSPGRQILSLSQDGLIRPPSHQVLKPALSFEAIQGDISSIQYHPPLILAAFSNNQVHIYRDSSPESLSSLFLDAAPSCLDMDALGKLIIGTPNGLGVWRVPSSLRVKREPQVYIADSEWRAALNSGHPRVPVQVGMDDGHLFWMDRRGRIQMYNFFP